MSIKNPSISTMCLESVLQAAQAQADRHRASEHGDELTVLAMRVLVKAIRKELKEVAQ